jgi:hypothetical protein
MRQVNIIINSQPDPVAIPTDIKAAIKTVAVAEGVAEVLLHLTHAIPLFTAGHMVVVAMQELYVTQSFQDIKTVLCFRTKWVATLIIAPPDIWGPNLEYNQLYIT